MKHINLFEQFVNALNEAKDIQHLTLYPSMDAFVKGKGKDDKITLTFDELDAATNELGRGAKSLSVVIQHILKGKKIESDGVYTPMSNDEGIDNQSKLMAKKLDLRTS